MREIKFRVWNKNEKIMYCNEVLEMRTRENMDGFIEKGIYLDLGEKDFIHMQYTGIKDKNGKEIYEGDIVKIESVKVNEDDYIIGKVIYSDYEGMYLTNKGYILGRISHRAEVIGNIYENKDLLKL